MRDLLSNCRMALCTLTVADCRILLFYYSLFQSVSHLNGLISEENGLLTYKIKVHVKWMCVYVGVTGMPGSCKPLPEAWRVTFVNSRSIEASCHASVALIIISYLQCLALSLSFSKFHFHVELDFLSLSQWTWHRSRCISEGLGLK